MNADGLLLIIFAALAVHIVIQLRRPKKKRGRRRKSSWFSFKRKKKAKPSWYWGNKRWEKIREFRREENRKRYGLPKGQCRCERCGDICEGKHRHTDHVYPRKHYRWLQYFYWNTQILCSECNIKKRDKPGHNWRAYRQWGLHPVVWVLRWRQKKLGLR